MPTPQQYAAALQGMGGMGAMQKQATPMMGQQPMMPNPMQGRFMGVNGAMVPNPRPAQPMPPMAIGVRG